MSVAIVDDDPRNGFAFSAILEMEGFDCEWFEGGQDFLDRFDQRAGCVLLDMMMPGIDGLEVLRQMHLRRWRTPVITLSYGGADRLGEQSLAAGALATLIRPVNGQELIEAVRNAHIIANWQERERIWRRA